MEHDRFRIAIIGLGYVGLPLAVHFAKKGIPVHGFDVNGVKIKKLRGGFSYIPDIPSEQLRKLINNKKLQVSFPSERITKATHIIVTVPTPLSKKRTPQLDALVKATQFIASHLTKGQTIIFESSTFPGTLEEVILPIFSQNGLKAGVDFYLGYSPERIDPGNSDYQLEQIPKVISGQTDACLEKVKQFYRQFFDTVVLVSSPKVAEMCKLFENIQRLVNISLVNEMEQLCDKMKIDFRESLQAAATKPFGFTPYWPGPGIGGHCIPVDPLYFQWKAKQLGLHSKLIQAADTINRNMPQEIVTRVQSSINIKDKDRKPAVLVIGISYKKDVNDTRESTAIEICRLLLQQGYELEYYDPFVPSMKIRGKQFVSKVLTKKLISEQDAVVILTDHSDVDWHLIKDHAKAIVDTRGVIQRLPGRAVGS